MPAITDRPTNYARNVFHIVCTSLALWLILHLDEQGAFFVAVLVLGLAWAVESLRLRHAPFNRLFMVLGGPFARPHEYTSVSSATWYITAMFGLACLWDLQVASVAVVVLGFGDPAAAIIGRRLGRFKLVHGRTVAGSLGFFIVAGGASYVWLRVFYDTDPYSAFLWAMAAAFCGMIAELFSDPVDDNFSIPLAAAAGAWLVSWGLNGG
jgi:dolichol kinase